MNEQEFKELLHKYQQQTATDEEKVLLEGWYLQHKESDLHDYALEEILFDAADVRENLGHQLNKRRIISYPWLIAAAACTLVLLSICGFYIFKSHNKAEMVAGAHHDVPPGQDKAVLTLANGHKIYITSQKKGIIYQQGALLVSRNQNGVLSYKVEANTVDNDKTNNNTPLKYNTLSTPRGGQSSITLSDGTVAYLDAQSSIRFPIDFSKSGERRVEVTGQVYFDVVHNAARPFRVDVKGQTIEDVGTSFNINAYEDEPSVKTTLITGSVKLTKGSVSTMLKPGQQAITVAGASNIQVKDADTEEVTAWKNGYFLFNNEKLESIMRKISRWYDVDVVNPNNQNTDIEYWGSITKYNNVSKVLKMLEITGDVKFKIESKKIIIEKK